MAEPHGQNIRLKREQLGMTRSELAEKIGRSYQHVYNLETNKNTAQPAIFYRIARALDLPIEQVMKDSGQLATAPDACAANPTSHPQPSRPVSPPRPTKSQLDQVVSNARTGAA
ncbi:helix-turn-helix transcriptional regulator [Saccharopolyspora shandongensis]|uniref:helix-turn-helix transcriptional regulator n=1 Tax=Saccharopolyspora shandongensis TaxID=418495 RepID=UPI0033D329EB